MSSSATLDAKVFDTDQAAKSGPFLRREPSSKDAAGGRSADAAAAQRRPTRKSLILMLIALGGLGLGAHFGWHWWTVGRLQEETDDAFLQADKVTVAPKVGGFVAESFVTDNQPVKAGDMIARIDDRDYRVVEAQDEADLDKSKASRRR